MAKNYAWDYEEDDHYHIYDVGDDAPDESYLFLLECNTENTSLIVKFVEALELSCLVGDRYTVNEIDCQLDDASKRTEAAMHIYFTDELPPPFFSDEVQKYIKRLTVIINRQAAYLRGER